MAWGVGQVASDRWWWSQWLLWIPAPAALASAIAGLLAMRAAGRGTRPIAALQAVAWTATACAAAATLQWLSWGQLAPRAGDAASGTLRIAHINARWPGDGTALAQALMDRPADVYAVSEAGALLRAPAARAAEGQGMRAIQVGRFALLTRLPVAEARAVYDDGALAVSWVRFAMTPSRPEWTVMLVDAPRQLRLSRREIFATLGRALGAMPIAQPDLVIGDLNATPGSVAVRDVWPGMTDASTQAGTGVRGTFPRTIPLWAIDRCLVNPGWVVEEWRAWDPGVGAHRGQSIAVTPPR